MVVLEQPDYTVGEDDGEVSVCALMEGGELDGVSVEVQLITLPASAVESSERRTELPTLNSNPTRMICCLFTFSLPISLSLHQ